MPNKPLTLIGFDFGTKSIGVAIGQTLTRSARPLLSLKAQNGIPNWKQIAQIIAEWGADALVVGIPLNMDGTQQSITKQAQHFAKTLREKFGLTVHLVDERLTTVAARAELFAKGGKDALKKSRVDAVAAQLILEDWMLQKDEIEERNK